MAHDGTLETSISQEFERVLISTVDIFARQQVERVDPSLVPETGDHSWIGAEISLDGDDCAGWLHLGLTPAAAIELSNAMLGIGASEVTQEVRDTVGELTNIMAGAAKANLSDLSLNPNLATPRPLSSEELRAALNSSSDHQSLVFRGLGGLLALNVKLLPLVPAK